MGRLKSRVVELLAQASPKLAKTAVQARRSLQARRRWARPKVNEVPYYPQQVDCQIGSLSNLYSQFLGEREDGTFVEVGANDGVLVSNTWGLASRGWRGLMLEPVPLLAEACRRNHRNHPRIEVLEIAISDGSAPEVTLSLAGAFTSANPAQMVEYSEISWSSLELTGRTIVVPADTLDNILARARVAAGFDVLVVDVEGYESAVFAGFSVASWKPKMMIIELADTHPQFRTTQRADAILGRSLLEAGYVVVFKDHINTVFVRDDVWQHAFADCRP